MNHMDGRFVHRLVDQHGQIIMGQRDVFDRRRGPAVAGVARVHRATAALLSLFDGLERVIKLKRRNTLIMFKKISFV